MAERFLDGELPLDAFIDVYQSKRKLAHMRRVKVEKLQELVLKGQRLPQVAAPLPPRVPEPAPVAPLPYLPLEASGPPLLCLGASPAPAPSACWTLSHPVYCCHGLRTAHSVPRITVPTPAPSGRPASSARILCAVCVAVPASSPPETPAPAASAPAGLHPAVSARLSFLGDALCLPCQVLRTEAPSSDCWAKGLGTLGQCPIWF